MSEIFRNPLVQVALPLAAMFALFALGIVILQRVRRWRGGSADDRASTHELLTKFREMHSQGGLSAREYRTIKTKLATQLETELNGDDKKS